jgi:hypothetical protein
MQFTTKNQDELDNYISFRHKLVASVNCTKFLGLYIDNKLTWKKHIDYLITKLSSARFIIRTVKPIMSDGSLRMLYFSYIHSIMTYGIIFWGNSPYSIKNFRIQKKVIRLMIGLRKRDSCRAAFRELKILPLCSQYIYSLM